MPVYSNLLTALGWSLLDSVWQMAGCWVIYSILTVGNKRFSAATRHNLALIFVVAGSAWFTYSFFHLMNEPADHFISGFIVLSKTVELLIPDCTMVYLAILALRSFRYGMQHYRHQKSLEGRSVRYSLESFANRNAQLLGVSKRISVYLSAHTETAQTSGFLKPLILLPVSLVTKLSPMQLEAILVHELFHIRRNDYLVNIFMSCYRGIFFFNPFAHLLYKAIAAERELACDDGVIQMNYQPALYAEALYNLEKFRQVQHAFSMAIDGNRPWLLMDRIRRLVGKPVERKNSISPVLIFNALVAIVLFGIQLESPDRPPVISLPASAIAAVPARYAVAKERAEIINKEIPGPSSIQKDVIKKAAAPIMLVIVNDSVSAVDPAVVQRIYSVNNIEIRNFSNESSPSPVRADVQTDPGMPYVPSASLSYQRATEIAPDSIPEKLAENNIRQMIAESHLQIANTLKQVQTELMLKKHYLKEMEIKNYHLLLLNQKSMRPLLENIQHEIERKTQQIIQLQIQLQISDEEIIHI